MCIAWLHIKICLYMIFFEVNPSSIQEDCLLNRLGGCKLDGVVVSIETHQELLQGWFPVGPDGKDVVDKSPPYQQL